MAEGMEGGRSHKSSAPALERRRFPKKLRVPDGWFDYKAYGEVISNTKILSVKTPLIKDYHNGLCRGQDWVVDYETGVCIEDEFTPQQMVDKLLNQDPPLKLVAVVDLTFTNRYYTGKDFEKLGIKHTKLKCPGRAIPTDEIYSRFAKAINSSLALSNGPQEVVAVHCTHGLNRTGYLVCRYLIKEKGYSPQNAIASFNKARGHDIERENYLEHLTQGCPPLPAEKSPVKFKGQSKEHHHIQREHHIPPQPYTPHTPFPSDQYQPRSHNPDLPPSLPYPGGQLYRGSIGEARQREGYPRRHHGDHQGGYGCYQQSSSYHSSGYPRVYNSSRHLDTRYDPGHSTGYYRYHPYK